MKLKVSFLLIPVALLTATSIQAADFVNSIGMEFKTLPAGSFYMGSCKFTSSDEEANKKRQFMGLPPLVSPTCTPAEGSDNDADDDETPKHLVKISKKFQIGVHEVTLGQYKKFIAAAGRSDLLSDSFIKHNNQGDDAPVVMVSWDDAQAFIRWLNQKENTKRYRLPTEAQWEYAARAGSTFAYHFSGMADDYAWYRDNSNDSQHPVRQKKPNAFGLYDMAGNAMEWVQDYYDGNYYRNNPPDTDPQGPSFGKEHVLRGGSWSSRAKYLRSADRAEDDPDDRDNTYGFRVVRM